MSVKLIYGPTLAELYLVCTAVPADEKEQYEAFAGKPFDADELASAYCLRDCPKWTIAGPEGPFAVGGFDMIRPGVWQDWLFSTPAAWSAENWRGVTRACRRAMDAMLRHDAHRLQCVSLASRVQAHRWYRTLGLQLEGTLHGYGVNGENALMFSRLRSQDG